METGNCISMISKLNIECLSKIGRFLNACSVIVKGPGITLFYQLECSSK